MLSSPSILATVPPLNLAHETDAAAGEGLEGFFFRSRGINDAAVATDGLFMLIFWFSMFFFVLLMGLMVYWGFFKYRRRPGVPAPVSPSHNTPLELVWTIVPSSALLVIFFLGFWTYVERHVASSDAIKLDVTAWKWGWGIQYPSGAESAWALPLDPGSTVSVPVFVVPEDTPISLRMKSNDVIHSFWIPDFRVKMDVFPNRYTGYTFRTHTLPEGEEYQDHWIFCAEYCGDFHSEMAAVLRVVPYGRYKQITETEWAMGDLSPVELGQRVYTSKCATCHSVDGSAMTGPTWLNLYGSEVPLADGTTVLGDDNYIRESIIYPAAKIHAGYAAVMPAFETLPEEQILGLIAYIESLSEFGSSGEEEGGEGGAGESGGDGSAEPEGGGASPPSDAQTGTPSEESEN